MPPKTKRLAHKPSTSGDDSLYMVLKVDNGELRELSSQMRPGTSDQMFDIARDSQYELMSGASGSRRTAPVNPKPCGECSASKSKCTPLPSNATLCRRCQSKGRTQCPPHIPWSQRKAQEKALSREASEPSQHGTSQGSSQPPEQPLWTPQIQPAPVAYYSEPYSMGVGEQSQHQFDMGGIVQSTYSHAPATTAQGSIPQGFHGVDLGAYGANYTHTDLSWYPGFSHDPMADQAGFPVPGDIQPAVNYQRTDGNHHVLW